MRSPQSAILQGVFVGNCMSSDFPLSVTRVEQEADEDGVYLNTFVVHLFSGTKIRVTVEDEVS